MYSFVAIVCTEPDEFFHITADRIGASIGQRADWRQSSQCPMIRAWDTITPDLIDDCGAGLKDATVFGNIYKNPPGNRFREFSTALDKHEAPLIRQTLCNIAMNFWGSYVAITIDHESRVAAIMRDPAGGMPCFLIKYRNCYIIFSRIQDIVDLLGVSLRLNVQYIIDSVTLRGLCRQGTGLEEVDQVLPGEVRYIDTAGCRSHFYWSPQNISGIQLDGGYDVASRLVCETLQHVIAALSEPSRPSLHSLGGLDSSIVLSHLVGLGLCDIHPFTLFTTEPMGDERAFARLNAAFYGIHVNELQMSASCVNLTKLASFPKQPLPPEHFDCSLLAGGVPEFSELHNATSIWTGFGGDNVFFRFPEVVPACDIFSGAIPLARIPMYLLDVARCGHESVYRTFVSACEDRIYKRPCLESVMGYMGAGGENSLFTKAALAESSGTHTLHPMLQLPARFPKGKGHHILTTAFVTLDPYDPWLSNGIKQLQRVSPLLSQPMIECCLALPLWILLRYGVDRALARRAYRHKIPPQVVQRIGKCDPSSFYDQLYRQNIDIIKETILDGRLAGLGLIDRVKAESLFSRFENSDGVGSMVALDTFSLETWASHWN